MKHLGDITKLNGAEIPVVRYKVYMYTFPDGKIYIGVTKHDLNVRMDNGYSHNANLKAALKCGWANVKKTILADGLTQSEAFEEEQRCISKFNATDPKIGYNISRGGRSTFAGLKHSEEYKRRMSEMYKGRTYSEETMQRMRDAHAKDRIPVVGINDAGVVERFESVRAAASSVGGYATNITRACASGRPYKGIRWDYERG